MMSVPLPISEGVSVIQDPIKMARGEAWADLIIERKTDLHSCHMLKVICLKLLKTIEEG